MPSSPGPPHDRKAPRGKATRHTYAVTRQLTGCYANAPPTSILTTAVRTPARDALPRDARAEAADAERKSGGRM